MTAQEHDYTRLTRNNRQDKKNQNTETKRGEREGSQASASREAQQVQGGMGGLSQGGSRSPGVLANSQGGAGGTNQGGSGRTGILANSQGGTGGRNQASTSQSGGQGGASCLAGSQGGPGRTGSLGGAGRARSLDGSGMASWPAEQLRRLPLGALQLRRPPPEALAGERASNSTNCPNARWSSPLILHQLRDSSRALLKRFSSGSSKKRWFCQSVWWLQSHYLLLFTSRRLPTAKCWGSVCHPRSV